MPDDAPVTPAPESPLKLDPGSRIVHAHLELRGWYNVSKRVMDFHLRGVTRLANGDVRHSLGQDIEMRSMGPEDDGVVQEPLFTLGERQLVDLMNDLWNAGVRPDVEPERRQVLGAMEDHIQTLKTMNRVSIGLCTRLMDLKLPLAACEVTLANAKAEALDTHMSPDKLRERAFKDRDAKMAKAEAEYEERMRAIMEMELPRDQPEGDGAAGSPTAFTERRVRHGNTDVDRASG